MSAGLDTATEPARAGEEQEAPRRGGVTPARIVALVVMGLLLLSGVALIVRINANPLEIPQLVSE